MHYPCRWRNTQTNKTFILTKTGMATIRIEARQQGGGNHGHAENASNGADFLFDHVESHPEVGLGLGSLLFYLACHEAALAGCTNVKVSAGAWSAEDFYFRMGCHRDPAVMANPAMTAGLNAE